MKLKALLVDDEYAARQELRYILDKFDDIAVVGEAASTGEAMQLLQRMEYDIIFLDIQMPGQSGLSLGAALGQMANPPRVIFVTAYDEYALQAFEVNATDYILKPLEEKRVRKAVDRVKTILARETGVVPPASPVGGKRINRLPVELSGRTFLIDIANISYVCSEKDTVSIRIGRDNYLTRLTLSAMEQRLHTAEFFRVHRSFIVNLRHVREIVPYFNGQFTLVMDNAERTEIPVSRNRVRQLRQILGF
jgi:two-component system LytT family response regulator/two-component system response regulator LytT